MLDLQSYLRGKGRNVPLKKGRLDLTSYMLGKAASGKIQEISGVLPLAVRSKATQTLINYRIYGTESGAGVETENGYKLPLKVTANGTTTDYPVYIGGSQLMEGEYVDYESGKIYKRGENEFPFAEEGTFTFGNGSVISDGAGTFIINTENNDTNVPSELIPLTTPYTVPQTSGEYTFYLGNTSTNSGLLIVFYDSERNLVDDWMYNSTWRKESSIPLMVGKTIAYVGFRINTNYSGSANMSVTPMISKNNNLTAYVPYIQPTDPPVPFPDISLPQGTVTIDIEGDLKPEATVKGRIE